MIRLQYGLRDSYRVSAGLLIMHPLRPFIVCTGGHVTHHVDDGGDAKRSPREPEPVWRRAVVKPAMSDALWEATRTEALGSDELQQTQRPVNYELYNVRFVSFLVLFYSLDICMLLKNKPYRNPNFHGKKTAASSGCGFWLILHECF